MPDNPAQRLKPRQPRSARPGAGSARAPLANPAFHIPIVGIGASAGGLEACSGFLDALPFGTGMAFILVQHLDPTHESLMVELLATHTSLTVVQAADGMRVACEHLYIIPPAFFLTVGDGVLRLKPTPARRGARLSFDVLLESMAQECGPLASCIVLSGTGADGSVGLRAIKKHGGFVLAQRPGEAGYDGMPQSAIATGAVDLVLPVAAMPEALAQRRSHAAPTEGRDGPPDRQDGLPDIIELLRTRTTHDFSLYKPGTLRRRVERRMAMAAIGSDDMGRYVTALRNDPDELERLAKDLLIHVTSFFRDPAVFEQLSRTIIPALIGVQAADHTLRIWVAGCSTGEEAYSLAMVFHEQIAKAGGAIKLQVFASDADADAVASAREGLYPAAIEAEVTPARLSAFFVKEDQSYRVRPELRAMVVFTVQDLLTDPPFSRLDLVSCRNVMIYLGAEAQRKLVALFHFALRPGGVLLLGNSESVGDAAERFEVISKPARLYRHIGRSRRVIWTLPGTLATRCAWRPTWREPPRRRVRRCSRISAGDRRSKATRPQPSLPRAGTSISIPLVPRNVFSGLPRVTSRRTCWPWSGRNFAPVCARRSCAPSTTMRPSSSAAAARCTKGAGSHSTSRCVRFATRARICC